MKENIDGKLILNVGIGALAAYVIIQGVMIGVSAINKVINEKGGIFTPQATNTQATNTQAPQS